MSLHCSGKLSRGSGAAERGWITARARAPIARAANAVARPSAAVMCCGGGMRSSAASAASGGRFLEQERARRRVELSGPALPWKSASASVETALPFVRSPTARAARPRCPARRRAAAGRRTRLPSGRPARVVQLRRGAGAGVSFGGRRTASPSDERGLVEVALCSSKSASCRRNSRRAPSCNCAAALAQTAAQRGLGGFVVARACGRR